MDLGKTLYVSKRKAWRAWLLRNHAKAKDIWLVYYKKHTGRPRIPYDDAVEEALCFGWIDSTVKRVDADRTAQRFSPRRATSELSQLNIERIRKLIAEEKMTSAGLEAIAHAFDPEKDKIGTLNIPGDILGPLKANKAAWKNFQGFPEAYKRIRISYISGRKRHGLEMFNKSLEYFIRMTAMNKKIGFVKEWRD